MTDVYTQESASKKKFLAPLLVILLCMVSLTAAGYAYSATVDNTGDDVVIEGVTMTLKNGDVDVTDAMYNVEGIDFATHTVNGKAVSSLTDLGFKDPAAAPDAYVLDELDEFEPGYYVSVHKDDAATSVGYKANGAYSDRAAFDALVTDAETAASNGLYKIGAENGYTLAVDNKSGLKVDIKAVIDFETFAYGNGVNAVYLLIDGGAAPALVKMAEGDVVLFEDLASNATASFTIVAYVALSDFYAASNALPAAGTGTFSISFVASTTTA